MHHRSRGVTGQATFLALLIAAILNGLVGCANSQSGGFRSSTTVMLFNPSTASWDASKFSEAKAGSEFFCNGEMYRVNGSGKPEADPYATAAKLFEADRPLDYASRQPTASDIVEVLDKDGRPVSHVLYSKVKPGAAIQFQGIAYSISSKGVGHVKSQVQSALQSIIISDSAFGHITDRHTASGTLNAGKSVFNSGESVRNLILDSQLLAPMPEGGGRSKRVFDAGRNIGIDRATGRETSTYTVITTDSGQLVTAFPGLP